MSLKNLFRNDEVEETTMENTRTTVSAGQIALFEPNSFDESAVIAAKIKSGSSVTVNLHRMSKDYAQRMIDFLTGVCFALDGTIQKIGHNLILCSPRNVTVSGRITMEADAD